MSPWSWRSLQRNVHCRYVRVFTDLARRYPCERYSLSLGCSTMVSPKNCRNASLVVPIDYICNSCNATRTVNMSGVFCLETLLAFPQLELACRKLLHLSKDLTRATLLTCCMHCACERPSRCALSSSNTCWNVDHKECHGR